MSAPDTLLELGRKLGIEDLAFQDNDTCQLIIGENLAVTIEQIQGEEAVYLYGEIGPKPASPGADLFNRLMSANYFGAETGGATLSLNPNTDSLVLWKRVNLVGVGGEGLHAEVQEFASWLLTWQEEFGHASANASGSAEPAPAPATGGPFLRV